MLMLKDVAYELEKGLKINMGFGVPCCDYCHDDVIKWIHSLRYWSYVRGIHRSRVNSPHKGQWRGALMFPLNAWVNNRNSGELRRHHTNYDATVIVPESSHPVEVTVCNLDIKARRWNRPRCCELHELSGQHSYFQFLVRVIKATSSWFL